MSDKDDHKTGGLASLLGELAEGRTSPALADIREIWANIFQIDGGGLRATIRQRIAALAIPFNRSSRQVIARPDRGRGSVTLRDGLEVIVVGPDLEAVTKLYDKAKEDALRYQRTIEETRLESPSWLAVVADAGPLPRPVGELQEAVGDCVPSRNAEDRVRRFPADTSAYREASSVNLASLVLLFRYRQRTFLFTGDGRGDLILEGLEAAGLLDENGGIHVDLLSVPHQGSSHNITVDFFERVTADHYLFSGDGTHENPSLSTVAALIHARGCDPYRMYFTDRDGVEEEHGAKLDAFFAAEREYRPSYRRFFRASSRNSLMVHLLDPVRY